MLSKTEIKERIEALSKHHQIEALRMLTKIQVRIVLLRARILKNNLSIYWLRE